jgi:hypothetical protein
MCGSEYLACLATPLEPYCLFFDPRPVALRAAQGTSCSLLDECFLKIFKHRYIIVRRCKCPVGVVLIPVVVDIIHRELLPAARIEEFSRAARTDKG